MASEKELKSLRGTAKDWDRWREIELHTTFNVKNIDFSEADLHSLNFSSSVLSGANFSNANLSNANLKHVDFSGANFSNANLKGASLDAANLSKANFYKANLENASLRDAHLHEALLVDANLRGVNFLNANLRRADLKGVNLDDASLDKADLREASLKDADLSSIFLFHANLIDVDFSGSNLRSAELRSADLRGSKFIGTDLSGASLSGADLSDADMTCANLTQADLSVTRVLGTDFSKATLTGAGIKDWSINSDTNFSEVQADYVYFGSSEDGIVRFSDRRPHSGIFGPNEFSTLFQQAVNTLELIFIEGIDWQAFVQSFQLIRERYSEKDIQIQAIERKRHAALVVRLEVPPAFDKAAIESSFKVLYEERLSLIEQRYHAELKAKDGELIAYKQQSSDLMEITRLLASKSRTSS